MKFAGTDLLVPIDILDDEEGNYSAVEGQFKTQQWELPLIFGSACPCNRSFEPTSA
jgi:hypothetical protein